MRLFSALVVVALALGCAQETFDLLPPPAEELGGGMAGGGRGGAQAGMGARGGRVGVGGRPNVDCPQGLMGECRGCFTSMDCRFGEICDRLRSYCAFPCQTNDECPPDRVFCDDIRH